MVNHTHQLVQRLLHRVVVTISYQLRQVQVNRGPHPVVQLGLGVLAIGKPFDLQDKNLRQPVQVQLPLALLEL